MDGELTTAEFLAIDAAFHVSLAAASGNDVIAAVMTGLRSSVEGYVLAGAAFLPSWALMAQRLRAEHRAIVGAIESRDAPLARTLVHNHITGYYADSKLAPLER